jgi:hypothetical protein
MSILLNYCLYLTDVEQFGDKHSILFVCSIIDDD